MEYFFLGDPELLRAFHFIGIKGESVLNAYDARIIFRKITEGIDESLADGIVLPQSNEPCKVLILTEEVADWLEEEIISWQLSDSYPLIVEIPGVMGKLPSRKTLVDLIREAIGIRI